MQETASFGAWVRARRRSLDLTQAALAARAWCAPITIRKIEGDERRPSRQLAELLADALDIGDDDRERFVAVARGELSSLRLTLGTSAGRPPRPLTSLLGRADELDDLAEMASFGGGSARLITITGPPGVGKTRLALEAGERARLKFDLPVIFVDLVSVDDPSKVMSRVAEAVPVPMGPSVDRIEAALHVLRHEPGLLIIDNAEHVIAGGGDIAHMLEACPDLCCLVTSRIRLGVYGEREYPLSPLAVPPIGVEVSSAGIRQWPALDLFLQRAALTGRAVVGADDLGQVAEICRLLDGLPLAIELAAGRVRSTPVERLAAQIAVDVGSLGTGARDRVARQRTVAGAVRWSYDLLSPAARDALRAASVFPGAFSRDALAGVAVDAGPEAIEELVDHALIQDGGDDRLALLAVVRAFAAGVLEDPERSVLQRRHAEYWAGYVETHASAVEAWSNDASLAAFGRVIDDVMTAVAWAFGPDGDPALGRRILIALGPYLQLRGRVAEAVEWLRRAVATTNDAAELAPLRFFWGECLFGSGDLDGCRAMFDEAERLARSVGDTRWLPQILGDQGMLWLILGRPDAAEGPLAESVELSLQSGSREGRALSHMRLGRLALLRGDLDEASRQNDLASGLYRESGDAWGEATTESNRGDFAIERGRMEEALPHLLAAIDRYLEGGFGWYAATRLDTVGACLSGMERFEAAAAVFGAADAWLADLGMPHSPLTSLLRPEAEGRTQEALGERYGRAAARGTRARRDRAGIARLVR